jgi:hypothetical protein
VNHGKYKGLRDMAQKREADRLRISEKRKKNKDVAIVSPSVADVAHAYADADAEKRGAQRERGSRLPPDWAPTEPLFAWASKERPDLDLTNTVAKFRDFWKAKPGRAGTKLDWDATFRNWVRDEKQGRQPSKNSGGHVIDDILARLVKVKRTGPNNWLACCPAHEDKSPSFTLHANPDGRILANCFSGCSFPDIVEAVGLGWEPWFPPKQSADYLPPIKHAFPAADVLKALADEADILCVVLHDSDWGCR